MFIRKLVLILLLILAFAADALAMKPFIAVMQATPENRVASFQDFDTAAEAQAFITGNPEAAPWAFVAPAPAEPTAHWLVDTVAQAITYSPDTVKLETQVKRAIRAEGKRRLSAFMEDADFEVAASIYLLYIRANGTAWKPGEQAVADGLQVKFNYVRDLYVTVTQAIAGVASMTQSQKVNFDAAADITWPTEPA